MESKNKKSLNNGNYEYPRDVIRICAEIIIILTDISKQSSTGCNLADLHEQLCTRFDSVIKLCRINSLSDNIALELLYPLAAFADETLLSIPHYRFFWSERPLQLRYFGEVTAGAKFFSKLEMHMKAGNLKREVLELYFFSLALGLKGVYNVSDIHAQKNMKIFEQLGVILNNIKRKHRKNVSAGIAIKRDKYIGRGFMLPAIYLGIACTLTLISAIFYIITSANFLKFLG